MTDRRTKEKQESVAQEEYEAKRRDRRARQALKPQNYAEHRVVIDEPDRVVLEGNPWIGPWTGDVVFDYEPIIYYLLRFVQPDGWRRTLYLSHLRGEFAWRPGHGIISTGQRLRITIERIE